MDELAMVDLALLSTTRDAGYLGASRMRIVAAGKDIMRRK
jgi:hypothetical protein